jgi:hypothetical protein
MLFSPLALPDITVASEKNGKTEKQVRITLKGVALFDRKRRTTEYKAADSGYVSAWYLDEDYDGDCFVDCQMFYDFKKAPNIKAALKTDVDPEEFKLKLASEPFPVRGYKRIAVKGGRRVRQRVHCRQRDLITTCEEATSMAQERPSKWAKLDVNQPLWLKKSGISNHLERVGFGII